MIILMFIEIVDKITSFLISWEFLLYFSLFVFYIIFLFIWIFLFELLKRFYSKISYKTFVFESQKFWYKLIRKLFKHHDKFWKFFAFIYYILLISFFIWWSFFINKLIISYLQDYWFFWWTKQIDTHQINYTNFDNLYIQNNKDKENSDVIFINDKDESSISFVFDLNELIKNNIIVKNTFYDVNKNNINVNINKYDIRDTLFHWLKWKSVDFFNTYLLESKNFINNQFLNKETFKDVNYEEFESLYNLNNISYSKEKLKYWLENNLIKITPVINFEYKENFLSKAYNWWDEFRNIIEEIYWKSIRDIYIEYKWIKLNSNSSSWFSLFQSIITIIIYWFIFFFLLKFLKNWWFWSQKIKKEDIVTEKDLWDIVEMWWNEDLNEMIDDIVKLNSISWWTTIKWILLYWPPGTWKTLFWKQVAKRLWLPFKYLSSWTFADKFVWWTQEKVRELFKQIREELKEEKIKQCILFLDELDSIWEKKNSISWQYSKDWLNQILTEIDWFKKEDWIILIWATNRFENLEDALVSRFDYKILVNLPTKQWREEIIKNQLKYLYSHSTNNWYIKINWIFNRKTDIKNWIFVKWDYTNENIEENKFRFKSFWKDICIIDDEIIENKKMISKYASLTEWFSGRDIKKVIDILYNKSILEEKKIDDNMIWRSIEEFIMWKDKKSKFDDEQLKIISYHELWHAILSKYVWKLVAQISVAAKSMSLWQTFSIDEKEKILKTWKDYLDNIYVLLWWRASEKLYLWQITWWSQNDYERTTELWLNYILLNFEYIPKHKDQIKKRLWLKNVEDLYKLWYVCKFDNLSNEEKSKIFEMLKIIICDCEISVEQILLENDKTMKHYVWTLIKNLVIFWEDFNLIK